ncbi:MAG: hypothetical protein QNJ63_31865 [Calothrix sp. MO_192.B10]|nr:hypothetical protein [Calothrix sp. MO_192.B10]
MKFKIFGVALALTFATVLGACDQTTTPTTDTTTSPGTTGEPADTGKPSPDATKSP